MVNTTLDIPSTYQVKALTLAQHSLRAKGAYQTIFKGDSDTEFLKMLEEDAKTELSPASKISLFTCSIEQVFYKPSLWFQRRRNRFFNHTLLLHLNYFFRV